MVDFGSNLYNNKLSLDKAKNEQDRSLKLINSLKKSLGKIKVVVHLVMIIKKKISKTIMDLKKIYKTGDDIIDVFKNAESEQKKPKK